MDFGFNELGSLEKTKMKSTSDSKNGRLAAASRDAVNKILDRRTARGSRGKKKQDDNCDSTKVCFFYSCQQHYCYAHFTMFTIGT